MQLLLTNTLFRFKKPNGISVVGISGVAATRVIQLRSALCTYINYIIYIYTFGAAVSSGRRLLPAQFSKKYTY